MKNQAYFKFLARVAELLSDYSADDLDRFSSIARQSYPALADVIDAAARLTPEELPSDAPVRIANPAPKARAAGKSTRADRSASRAPRKPKAPAVSPAELRDLLMSTEIFPSNIDLAEFARLLFPDLKQKTLTSGGRAQLVNRIATKMDEVNGSQKRRLVDELLRIKGRNSDARSEGFFTKWEGIIKQLAR